MLTVHLEESDCFATWVSAKEVGMLSPNDVQDIKCKVGVSGVVVVLVSIFYMEEFYSYKNLKKSTVLEL